MLRCSDCSEYTGGFTISKTSTINQWKQKCTFFIRDEPLDKLFSALPHVVFIFEHAINSCSIVGHCTSVISHATVEIIGTNLMHSHLYYTPVGVIWSMSERCYVMRH